MVTDRDSVSILVVDDRPDKLLAIEAALDGLSLEIVKASSGREALRCLLTADFAVILLDVNMPGMDGFETARLIRQRKSCKHVPIIFITAFGDDMHVAQGYSLGAVDYILTPIVPEVLRTKVAVFLELFKKTQEIRRQARSLERRALALHRLNEASLAIHSALSIDRMIALAAETAKQLTSAEQAVLLLDAEQLGTQRVAAISNPEGTRIVHGVDNLNRREPVAAGLANGATHGNDPRAASDSGELCIPLLSRDRRGLGSLRVRGKRDEHFNDDDRALLIQLAQITAVAVENCLFAEAREANRIKDEFLATLSHELRTPLTAILGWTQLLKLKGPHSEEAEHGLEVIERNVGAQTKLIDDLLDISRIATGKLRLNAQQIELRSIVQNAIDVVRPASESKHIQLSVQLPETPCLFDGDPDRLQQVVWNLVSNSLKFTSSGGRIDVALRNLAAEFEIEVRDTGIGIHPGFVPHIFDRFRQADSSTRRRHSGLGIGLALVRHVVELHKGSVMAHSPGEGQGATFVVRLPKVAGRVARPDEPPLRDTPSNGNPPPVDLAGVRILLVEDEDDTREMVHVALARYGAIVKAAASVSEALDALMQSRPDVIISDLGMPEMDGYDLMRSIRALFHDELKSVPAIALTAFARDEDRRRVLEAGFRCHVAKPVQPPQLAAAVASLVQPPQAVDC